MTTAVGTATAVGYFRVSTAGQAGERSVSLEAQATQFHSYCRKHDLDPGQAYLFMKSMTMLPHWS